MGIPLMKAKHILVAEKEGLGTTNLEEVQMNNDWEKFKMQFSVNKTLIDTVSGLLFNSDVLAKIVIASPFTPLIYKVAGSLRNSEETKVADEKVVLMKILRVILFHFQYDDFHEGENKCV